MELGPVVLAHVIVLSAGLEMWYQVLKLKIIRIFLERGDWNAIIKLLPKGVRRVVDEQNVLQINIFKYSQVFDIFATFRLDTTCAVEPVLDELASWI